MKASEVIKRYAAGERDFRRVNLRGLSFKGADLSGADFSVADIRGANFKGATLQGTKFCAAKPGLQKRSTFILLIASWIMSAIAAFIFALAGVLVSYIFDNSSLENQLLGWESLGVLIIIFAVIIRQGVGEAVALALAVAGALAVTLALALALAGMLVSVYLGWRAMKGDPRDAWVRTIAVAFAATGGTTFYNADLTDADFTRATVHSTDLRAKSLTRTCCKDTIKLIQARPGKTILADSNVRELLVTGNGYKKSYRQPKRRLFSRGQPHSCKPHPSRSRRS